MPARITLSVPRETAELTLAGLIENGESVEAAAGGVRDEASFDDWKREAKRWRAYTKTALQTLATEDALLDDFENATQFAGSFSLGPTPLGERLNDCIKEHTREVDAVRSIVDRLELFDCEADLDRSRDQAHSDSPAKRVFVVHGRQRDSADVVARFVARLGLEAVILDEQANEGRTILEKLEANTEDVGFAIVLLQADDYARGPDDNEWPDKPTRARQNVILELGFFVGKIGRNRVAALAEPNVEQPSDILGLAYITFDSSWQLRLARELKQAYPGVDLNLIA